MCRVCRVCIVSRDSKNQYIDQLHICIGGGSEKPYTLYILYTTVIQAKDLRRFFCVELVLRSTQVYTLDTESHQDLGIRDRRREPFGRCSYRRGAGRHGQAVRVGRDSFGAGRGGALRLEHSPAGWHHQPAGLCL